jgi:hypothetical protein
VAAWYQELLALPEFAKEIAMAPHVAEAVATAQRTHQREGKSLEMVAGF